MTSGIGEAVGTCVAGGAVAGCAASSSAPRDEPAHALARNRAIIRTKHESRVDDVASVWPPSEHIKINLTVMPSAGKAARVRHRSRYRFERGRARAAKRAVVGVGNGCWYLEPSSLPHLRRFVEVGPDHYAPCTARSTSEPRFGHGDRPTSIPNTIPRASVRCFPPWRLLQTMYSSRRQPDRAPCQQGGGTDLRRCSGAFANAPGLVELGLGQRLQIRIELRFHTDLARHFVVDAAEYLSV